MDKLSFKTRIDAAEGKHTTPVYMHGHIKIYQYGLWLWKKYRYNGYISLSYMRGYYHTKTGQTYLPSSPSSRSVYSNGVSETSEREAVKEMVCELSQGVQKQISFAHIPPEDAYRAIWWAVLTGCAPPESGYDEEFINIPDTL